MRPEGRSLAAGLFGDELHRVADGLNVLSGVVGDFDVELFFERHHQFNIVQAVCAQVIDKGRLFGDLLRIGIQVFDNDLTDAFENVGHTAAPFRLWGTCGWFATSVVILFSLSRSYRGDSGLST